MKTALYLPAAFFFSILFLSCKGEDKLSDQELIEKNVRTFFFLDDSVKIDVTITDTLRTSELNEMLTTVDDNFNLIQQDIDTLQLMIDDWSYKALELEKQNALTESKDARIKSLEYRVKLKELEAQKQVFVQTNRILNRLQRSIWADIAGFDATATFTSNGETNSHVLLLDAGYNVVD